MDRYCLDANFFIEGWNKYYAPAICSGYWEIIETLGREGVLFVPQMVKTEIDKVDDTLKAWFKDKNFLIKSIDANVQQRLKDIYAKDERHKRLVDSSKQRSLADPWVIAHAMAESATVVTKENKITDPNSDKIRIPNVCENMGIAWMDDFQFVRQMQIRFECKR